MLVIGCNCTHHEILKMFSRYRHWPIHVVFWGKILRSWPLQATGGDYQVSDDVFLSVHV